MINKVILIFTKDSDDLSFKKNPGEIISEYYIELAISKYLYILKDIIYYLEAII